MDTAILLLSVLVGGDTAAATGSGIVRVTVSGYSAQWGTMTVYLFQEDAGMPPEPEEVFASTEKTISDSTLSVSFLGVPFGQYAVLAYQDTDGDGEPDMGQDAEPCGYSMGEPPSAPAGTGGAGGSSVSAGEDGSPDRPRMGTRPSMDEPTFDLVSFDHSSDETEVMVMIMGAGPSGRPAGGPPGGGAGGGGPGGDDGGFGF
jgi:uncharacterized protein (DUF2141 family)